MADITLRLIWYKLGESTGKMAEAAATWYSKLRWEDHVLDALLIGWICWCSAIVVVINSFRSFVGPLQRRLPSETLTRVKDVGSKPIQTKGGGVETCQWFNTGLNWCYLHYYHSAEFLDEWIKSLNDQINKLGGPVQTKFERIQAGSLPPKFTDVSCEATPEDKFVIHVRVDSRDLAFVIFCSQQTHEGVKLTNCTATVFRLRGTLLVKAFKEAGEVKVTVGFDGRPDIKVNVKPTNPYQDPADMVDIGIVEESVRQAICMTTTTFVITHLLTPDLSQVKGHSGHDRGAGQGQGPSMNQGYNQMAPMSDGNYERRMPQTHGSQPMQSMNVQSTQLQSTQKRKPAPQQPQLSTAAQRLPQNEALFVPIEAEKYQSAAQQIPQTQSQAIQAHQTPHSGIPLVQTQPRAPKSPQTQPQGQKSPQSKSMAPESPRTQQQGPRSPQAKLQTPKSPRSQPKPQESPPNQSLIQQEVDDTDFAPYAQIDVRKMADSRARLTSESAIRESRPFVDPEAIILSDRAVVIETSHNMRRSVTPPREATLFQTPVSSAAEVPPKPPRFVGEKRLLVKVIKANGVGAREIGSVDPVVVLLMDDPIQNHSTSTVRNTVNPFWDESFLFDVTQNSNELRFEVYDKTRQAGEDFLGETTVYVEDLRRTPSSRQILALQARPGHMDSISGSLTAEFLYMDSAEAEMMLAGSGLSNNQLSPKRRIETERTVTPGGTIITTTTTTTHKPQFHINKPGVDGSPSTVEKHHRSNPDLDSSDTISADRSSPYLGRSADLSLSESASSELLVINGVESVAETAIRELKEQSRRPRTPTKTSTLIITGVKREPVVPQIKTIESSPTEEGVSPTAVSPVQHGQDKEKKKSSFGDAIRKRFGRKKRSQSADRASTSLKEGPNYLRPPDQTYGPQSKDDMELVRSQEPPKSPNLKKSRSLGGSLKKLFRRGRKRSKSRGETSRESSFSRSSGRQAASQNPSRDSSLNRHSAHQRSASTS